jgi:hypothetical protein
LPAGPAPRARGPGGGGRKSGFRRVEILGGHPGAGHRSGRPALISHVAGDGTIGPAQGRPADAMLPSGTAGGAATGRVIGRY